MNDYCRSCAFLSYSNSFASCEVGYLAVAHLLPAQGDKDGLYLI